tara:strand:+ start:13204 stop:14577 length:1374 start_codon:yes stop_codon:yes gene_type:complete
MQKPNKYISERGYVLKKSSLSSVEKETLTRELTVSPNFNVFQNGLPQKFRIYLENESKYYIPRFYGLNKFGPPEKNYLEDAGDNKELVFHGNLREYQKPIIDKMIDTLYRRSGGILNLFTGQGKTVIAIKIMSILKKKTLIIVHKEFLLNQWVERLNQFMPDIKIGFIQQKKVEVDGFDVVIGMLQSISMKTYPEDTFKSFGFTIVDEAHHISSEVFSRALPKISTKYLLGLSATLDRKDGLRFVFEWFLGEPVQIKNEKRELGDVYINKIKFKDSQYQQQVFMNNGNTNLPRMINMLTESPQRLNFTINILKECKKFKRKVLLLSERRNHLEKLGETCKNNGMDFGYYMGGLKLEVLRASEEKDIILGTYNMISEGFDLKELDTLIFSSPKSDVVQASGRILRQGKDRPTIPVIIDIVDDTEFYKKTFSKRNSYYKKNDFIVTDTPIQELFNKIKK